MHDSCLVAVTRRYGIYATISYIGMASNLINYTWGESCIHLVVFHAKTSCNYE